MERRFEKLATLGTVLFAAALLSACGSGDGGGNGGANTTTVYAYVTDNLEDYDSVEFTLQSVALRHTGSGRNCEIITGPLTIDAAELGHDEIIELVDTTNCESGSYNRLHVALSEDVTLVRTENGQTQTDQCKFKSYKDDHTNQPNVLNCNNGICSLNINGAVNLVAGKDEHVALDVDLKAFEVDYDATPCSVTLKVSPLHGTGMDDKMKAGYKKSISGVVSDLDAQADRFTLTRDGVQYVVDYVGVSDQAGLDDLLSRAAADQLKTKVRCYSIDEQTSPPTCVAQSNMMKPLNAVIVEAEGTVSNLDASVNYTFDLTYDNNVVLPVNYAEAVARDEVEGTLDNGVTAEVELFGFDVGAYLAREVEVQTD